MDYTEMLFNKYGTALLKTKQVAEITGRTARTLTEDRRNNKGIPYRRLGDGDNSPVRYPIHEVSKWMNEVAM